MQIILKILSFLAKLCIKRHKPFVVWITWSVGKTSATSFIYQLLKEKYGENVYKSPYNYNGEFGLPLTILQQKTWWRNPFVWLYIFIKSIFVIFSKKYPKVLVLEYWIDHIWEMDYMIDIVTPNISVILNIFWNHLMQLNSVENIKKEKLKIIWENSKVIFNNDDDRLSCLKGLDYWVFSSSKLKAKNVDSLVGKISFDLIYWGKEYRNIKFNIVWKYQVYNILAMIGVWLELWFTVEEIINSSRNLFAPEWRWTILEWINNSIIIDGSYNWGYNSILEGLKYLESISDDYCKIALLWDMRELWTSSRKYHKKISNYLLEQDFDYIVLVWKEFIKYSKKDLIFKFWENRVFTFLDSRKAWEKIKVLIEKSKKQSIVFVKWSQNTIFLEEGIKEFCLDWEKSKLVRQSKKWMKIKGRFYKWM